MKQTGKVGKEWIATRREWVHQNPPNHQGYYTCAICGRWVLAEEVEIDHIIPRSAAPELRADLKNLQATCHRCNTRKGSKH